jgi:cation:H+ antiporter
MWQALVGLVIGLLILTVGAELLVRGAATIALRAGLRPIIVGLTVVALGTSSPELMVSLTAAIRGYTDVAIGNVVGSNIFNILAILGFAAIVRPMSVRTQTIRYEMPFMIGISVVMLVMGLDGRIGRTDGVILLLLFVLFMVYCYVFAKLPEMERAAVRMRSSASAITLTILGCVGLAGGGQLCSTSAVVLARAVGVSELVIGLTVIAFGTSLPELAASVVAALRGQEDLSIGNVVGSNIFNVGLVLGLTALIHPVPVPMSCAHVDMPVAVVASIVVLPLMWIGHRLARLEGILLVGCIVGYTLLRYAYEMRLI